jgi:hypothetical protein
MFASTLSGCARTKTILIKEPKCVLAQWPEFPDVYLLRDCPEGAICTAVGDHLRIVGWINQVNRIHATAQGCPNVEFRDLPTETPAPTPKE